MSMTLARPLRFPAPLLPALMLLLAAPPSQAEPPPIEVLAARPAVIDASLSPDGHSIAIVRAQAGKAALVLFDRQTRKSQVLMGEPKDYRFMYCHWVSNQRIVCSFIAFDNDAGDAYARTRLVGIDVDGQNMRPLAQSSGAVRGEVLTDIVSWHTNQPETILFQADAGAGQEVEDSGGTTFGAQGTYAVPSVFELDTRNDRVHVRQKGRAPILSWAADADGEVRLGWGLEDTKYSYYARLAGDSDWRRLARVEAFGKSEGFAPVALSKAEPNKAYAMSYTNGREAVWMIDLADKAEPKLLYSHDLVDVGGPLFDRRHNLIGFAYETDRPHIYYTDPDFAGVAAAVEGSFPDQAVVVGDRSDDGTAYLFTVGSDRSAEAYYLYDRETHKLTSLGAPHPGLDPAALAPMKPISFAARDGKMVAGYLTMPPGAAGGKVPLVVMPHGGPIARDSWEFDFLRHYLSTRGYAVLQVNFRGSSGYGYEWQHAAHQDWGGLSYDDVIDGVRWAIKQGVADPAKVAIVGWSFGGYITELAAARNPELFKCAASVAGVSDLSREIDSWYWTVEYKLAKAQIGLDKAKLQRDSPLQHADDFKVPILLVHGDDDTQVDYEQSKLLDKALSRANKPHRFVTIKGGDHSLLHAESDRVTLLHELDDFMAKNCPAGG
jgi:dipeptidyl aminopeptidase/acylaminoacyl peptidase